MPIVDGPVTGDATQVQ